MSDIPISSERASDNKERPSQEASDLLPGSALPRHPVLSDHKLSLRPIPERDSLSADAERELSLHEIIKNVPDIVYEFARDAVLALSEREHFTPSEIGSLKKSEVMPGGGEIRGRKISDPTTTTLAVYIGAVRTYLPSGQWERESSSLFDVYGQNIGLSRPENDFATIDSDVVIRTYINENFDGNFSLFSEEERKSLHIAPARSIRLEQRWGSTYARLRQETREPLSGKIERESRLQSKPSQEHAESVSEQIEGLKQPSAQCPSPVESASLSVESAPEHIVAHSNFSRALIRDLLESNPTEEAMLSSERQVELEQSITGIERLYLDINSSAVLSSVEKKGLRLNCELIAIQLRKLLRGVHLQPNTEMGAHPALRQLDRAAQLDGDDSSEISFSEKLEVVLQDLKALRKKSSSIF